MSQAPVASATNAAAMAPLDGLRGASGFDSPGPSAGSAGYGSGPVEPGWWARGIGDLQRMASATSCATFLTPHHEMGGCRTRVENRFVEPSGVLPRRRYRHESLIVCRPAA